MNGVFPDDEPLTSDSRSPLSTKLAAYGLALEQRLKLVEAKGKVGDENAEDKEALVSLRRS